MESVQINQEWDESLRDQTSALFKRVSQILSKDLLAVDELMRINRFRYKLS